MEPGGRGGSSVAFRPLFNRSSPRPWRSRRSPIWMRTRTGRFRSLSFSSTNASLRTNGRNRPSTSSTGTTMANSRQKSSHPTPLPIRSQRKDHADSGETGPMLRRLPLRSLRVNLPCRRALARRLLLPCRRPEEPWRSRLRRSTEPEIQSAKSEMSGSRDGVGFGHSCFNHPDLFRISTFELRNSD